MSEQTALDRAWEAMQAEPEADAPRLRFYERLADGEMFLLLEREPEGDRIEPRQFPLDEGPYVLIFDREERLTRFTAGPAPYASLPGRRIATMLAGQGIGIGLNLGAGPSEMLLPPMAVSWLSEMVGHAPQRAEERIEEVMAPFGVPEGLLGALDAKLASTAGLAAMAYLCGVRYAGGRRSHLLAYVEIVPGAETVLAQAVNEALAFSGLEAGELDVAFFAASHPMAARFAKWGLRFDLPEPVSPGTAGRPDPDSPPRLR